jgi:hypothetical protein
MMGNSKVKFDSIVVFGLGTVRTAERVKAKTGPEGTTVAESVSFEIKYLLPSVNFF